MSYITAGSQKNFEHHAILYEFTINVAVALRFLNPWGCPASCNKITSASVGRSWWCSKAGVLLHTEYTEKVPSGPSLAVMECT